MNVVTFAHQVLDMQARIHELEEELADLREYKLKYNDLLNSSMTHSRNMMFGIMSLAMEPGVLEALGKK